MDYGIDRPAHVPFDETAERVRDALKA